MNSGTTRSTETTLPPVRSSSTVAYDHFARSGDGARSLWSMPPYTTTAFARSAAELASRSSSLPACAALRRAIIASDASIAPSPALFTASMSTQLGRSRSGTMPSARARSPIVTYSFWLVAACCDVAGACFLRTSAAASAQPLGGIISSTSRSDARPASAGKSSSVKRFAADGAVAPFCAWASPIASTRASPAIAARNASRAESNCSHPSSPHATPRGALATGSALAAATAGAALAGAGAAAVATGSAGGKGAAAPDECRSHAPRLAVSVPAATRAVTTPTIRSAPSRPDRPSYRIDELLRGCLARSYVERRHAELRQESTGVDWVVAPRDDRQLRPVPPEDLDDGPRRVVDRVDERHVHRIAGPQRRRQVFGRLDHRHLAARPQQGAREHGAPHAVLVDEQHAEGRRPAHRCRFGFAGLRRARPDGPRHRRRRHRWIVRARCPGIDLGDQIVHERHRETWPDVVTERLEQVRAHERDELGRRRGQIVAPRLHQRLLDHGVHRLRRAERHLEERHQRLGRRRCRGRDESTLRAPPGLRVRPWLALEGHTSSCRARHLLDKPRHSER